MRVLTLGKSAGWRQFLGVVVTCAALAACGGGGGGASEPPPQSGGGDGGGGTGGGGTGGGGTGGGAGGPSSYDVGSRVGAFNARLRAVRVAAGQSDASAFSGLMLPTAPSISRRVTVANASELASAASMNNVEVTFVGSGFTARLDVSGRSDQRWIFPAGFTLSAPDGDYAITYNNASRVEFIGTGGRVVGGIAGIGPSDMTMRGMDIRTRTNSAQSSLDMHSVGRCSRMLIDSSYLFARSYAMIYSDCTHFVVANTQVISAGEHATARTSRSDLVLWMDSRLVTGGQQQIFRAHENTNRFAGWNLQIEGGTGVYVGPAGTSGLNAMDLVLLDNGIYADGQAISASYTSETGANIAVGTIVGNHGYTNWESGAQLATGNTGPGWIVGDNPRLSGATPPPWTAR